MLSDCVKGGNRSSTGRVSLSSLTRGTKPSTNELMWASCWFISLTELWMLLLHTLYTLCFFSVIAAGEITFNTGENLLLILSVRLIAFTAVDRILTVRFTCTCSTKRWFLPRSREPTDIFSDWLLSSRDWNWRNTLPWSEDSLIF